MRSSHSFFVPVFVIASMLLLPSMLLADVTGSINGVVHDPSQAVVKGVQSRSRTPRPTCRWRPLRRMTVPIVFLPYLSEPTI